MAGLVKKKNEERRYSPSIASITADASDEFFIMYSSPLRVYRSLRCAPFRVYIMKIIRRLPAALGGSHERIHPAGTPRSAQVGQCSEVRRCARAPARFDPAPVFPLRELCIVRLTNRLRLFEPHYRAALPNIICLKKNTNHDK